MKTILLTATMALIAFGVFGVSSSYAHCGICEASEKAHAEKPCTYCKKANRPCKCGTKSEKPCSKKPCKYGDKKAYDKEKKPCEKSKSDWSKKELMFDHSAKGSLTIHSGSAEGGRYN